MADVDSVSWHQWWTERDGSRTPLPPVLERWDYAREETVGISVDVNEEALLRSTGLPSINELEILAMADCSMMQQRFIGCKPLAGHEPGTAIDVVLQLPRGRIADSVNLSAHLVLSHTSRPRDNYVAYARGARIHSSTPFSLRLEGSAGRFPTEAVPFSELGFVNAPWSVACAYGELSDSFMGRVRLLINTEHPVGRLALEPAAPPWIGRMLRMEVMRLLIAEAAGLVEVADDSSFDEGSVWHVLENMCKFFLGRGLKAAVRLYRDEPTYFDRLLHDQIDPLAGAIA